MFRAITDYFFGGATEEPQSPLETQEVNDWLVVNMADRPQDDIVMIESTKPDPMSDSEYEDILDAVSCLMRAVEEPVPELEPSDGESTVESSDGEEEEDDEEEEEEKYSKRDIIDLDSSAEQASLPFFRPEMFFDNPVFQENFRSLVQRLTFGPLTESFYQTPLYRGCQITEQEVVQHFETVPVDNRMKAFHQFNCEDIAYAQELMEEEEDEYDVTMINELSRPEIRIVHCKAEQEMPNNRFVLPRRYARMYSHVLDATSKDYISLHKAEIQQRIHEVEREQKLKKYKTEKVINKGQLNRQNKNYLFQSSCKKNRRRDLQRSHSGANNNRKCSC